MKKFSVIVLSFFVITLIACLSTAISSLSAQEGAQNAVKLSTEPVELEAAPAGSWSIQAASRQNIDEIREMISGFHSKGVKDGFYMIPRTGTWHAIFIGIYTSTAETKAAGDALKKKGVFDSFLVKKTPNKRFSFSVTGVDKTKSENQVNKAAETAAEVAPTLPGATAETKTVEAPVETSTPEVETAKKITETSEPTDITKVADKATLETPVEKPVEIKKIDEEAILAAPVEAPKMIGTQQGEIEDFFKTDDIKVSSYTINTGTEGSWEPEIEFFDPIPGENLEWSEGSVFSQFFSPKQPLFTIVGKADKTYKVSADEKPLTLDDEGNFRHTIKLHTRNNVVKFTVMDEDGKRASRNVVIENLKASESFRYNMRNSARRFYLEGFTGAFTLMSNTVIAPNESQNTLFATNIGAKMFWWINQNHNHGVYANFRTSLFRFLNAGSSGIRPTLLEWGYNFQWEFPGWWIVRASRVYALCGFEIYHNAATESANSYFFRDYQNLKLGAGAHFPLGSYFETGGELGYGTSFQGGGKMFIEGNLYYFPYKRWSVGGSYMAYRYKDSVDNILGLTSTVKEVFFEMVFRVRYSFDSIFTFK